ncbi:MAG: hypothetical protein JWM44_2294 [Bacilli bacterium]|nr:hypothetical protein [Bacilli bacterium]
MEMNAKVIRIKNTYVKDKYTVNYSIYYGLDVKKFFTGEPFFSQYTLEITDVPQSILNIPLLASLMPVAWAAGADVYVQELDKQYYESLLTLKAEFSAMYPKMNLSGTLHVARLVDNQKVNVVTRSAIFFTSGVDSMATFIRKKQENPYFITIWGADVFCNQKEFWREVTVETEQFGRKHGIESLFIKSSLRSFLNEHVIGYYFGRFLIDWWVGVQHAMGMVGLCAPIAYLKHIQQIYIPSSFPVEHSKIEQHGSSRRLDNQIKWSGTEVKLEALELWRQEKVKLIAEYIRHEDPELQLRVCWNNPVYGNCSQCEKCARTIVALITEGIDPNHHGFKATPQSIDDFRNSILKLWLNNTGYIFVEWDKIKQRSLQQIEQMDRQYAPFFHWLHQIELKKRNSPLRFFALQLPSSWFIFFRKIWFSQPQNEAASEQAKLT